MHAHTTNPQSSKNNHNSEKQQKEKKIEKENGNLEKKMVEMVHIMAYFRQRLPRRDPLDLPRNRDRCGSDGVRAGGGGEYGLTGAVAGGGGTPLRISISLLSL